MIASLLVAAGCGSSAPAAAVEDGDGGGDGGVATDGGGPAADGSAPVVPTGAISDDFGLTIVTTWRGTFTDRPESATFLPRVTLLDLAAPTTLLAGATVKVGTDAMHLVALSQTGAATPYIYTAVPAASLAFTGKVAIDVVAGAKTAVGSFDAPMPWVTITTPKTAALGTALDLVWPATPGATCLVRGDDQSASHYASADGPDVGKLTIPAAMIKEKGPYSLSVVCQKTLVVKPGVSLVARMERRDVVMIQ